MPAVSKNPRSGQRSRRTLNYPGKPGVICPRQLSNVWCWLLHRESPENPGCIDYVLTWATESGDKEDEAKHLECLAKLGWTCEVLDREKRPLGFRCSDPENPFAARQAIRQRLTECGQAAIYEKLDLAFKQKTCFLLRHPLA